MRPLNKLVAGFVVATADMLPLSASAITAPVLADAHTNSALPANNFGNLPTHRRFRPNRCGGFS